MPEITLPKNEFRQGPIQINLNKYLPEEEKRKNLARLSDEEIAQLSPEELEEAKKAGENLVAIIHTKKEVENMENQEKWAAAVQQFANEHGISTQEAEDILKKRAGINAPTDLASIFAALKPEPSLIEKAISEAMATRINNIAPLLFGTPPDNTGGKSAQAVLSDALKQAKAFGAQSIYLPDGTMVKLTEDGGGNQDAVVKSATTQIKDYVEGIINQRLPAIFNPPATGGIQVGDSSNPEIVKLFLEDQSRQEDRKAADARSERRDSAVKDIAAMIASIFSPEGYVKFQKFLKEGPTGIADAGRQVGTETKREAKMQKTTCWKCLRVFPYEGEEPSPCPYCGQAQKVQCPKCEHTFTPTNRNRIECPNCHAVLQKKPEEQGNPPATEEEKKTSPESPGPAAKVGAGID